MTTNIDFAKAKKLLTKVFGKDILFESKLSQHWNNHDGKPAPCAWNMVYSGEIFLQIDLPPLLAPHFVSLLQAKLQWAIEKEIDPKNSCKNNQERSKLLRDSDWPLPSEVIRDNLSINTDALQFVAEHLTKPVDMVGSTIREMLAHEAVWIDRKQSVVSVCNALFLGLQQLPKNLTHSGFCYGKTSGNRSGVELAFKIGSYSSPFSEEVYPTRRAYRDRNHALGLEGMLAYEHFEIGTHAPIEEHKFALYGISDAEIANKLERLRQPERLAVTQQYIHEVIAATSVQHWFRHNEHPDYRIDVQEIMNSVPRDVSDKKQRGWFDRQKSELEASPKYALWDTVFPQLAQNQPTVGGLVQTIDCEPPKGQEEVYTRLQKWADETFPLLKPHLAATRTSSSTKPFKQGTTKPTHGG